MKKKMLPVLGMVLALVTFQPRPAVAIGFPVIDIANLVQSLIAAVQMIQQVVNSATQIQNQFAQLQAKAQSLQGLGQNAFNGSLNMLGNNFAQINGVINSMEGIGYTVNNIGAQFDAMFPDNINFQNVNIADFENMFQNWSNELAKASKSAMNAQSVISNVQNNNAQMQQILAMSSNNQGEVRQLQAQNQALSVLGRQLNDITTVLASTGRVTATAAAESAGQKIANTERKRRAIANYGVLQPPTNPLQAFPAAFQP